MTSNILIKLDAHSAAIRFAEAKARNYAADHPAWSELLWSDFVFSAPSPSERAHDGEYVELWDCDFELDDFRHVEAVERFCRDNPGCEFVAFGDHGQRCSNRAYAEATAYSQKLLVLVPSVELIAQAHLTF